MPDRLARRLWKQEAAYELPPAAVLRFSPTAWAKLLFLRDFGETEVGGFAITETEDLLFVQDIRLVRQECTVASVSFDDAAAADFFDEQVDRGLKPERFGRVWIHTHPGNSPQPSSVDEQTFARVFGRAQWTVMFVLAQNDNTYARLRFNVGPGGAMTIPVRVDYTQPFAASDEEAWIAEYRACVRPAAPWPADPWDPFADLGLGSLALDATEGPWPAEENLPFQKEELDGYP
jgi:proteasome lid subunit RPN8/RPN11